MTRNFSMAMGYSIALVTILVRKIQGKRDSLEQYLEPPEVRTVSTARVVRIVPEYAGGGEGFLRSPAGLLQPLQGPGHERTRCARDSAEALERTGTRDGRRCQGAQGGKPLHAERSDQASRADEERFAERRPHALDDRSLPGRDQADNERSGRLPRPRDDLLGGHARRCSPSGA